MRAVVVEIKLRHAILLQEDGTVVKRTNRNYTIGDVVYMKEKKFLTKGKIGAMVAAAAMFVMILGGGIWAYATPYYYVSLDVNPSVLMEVNRFENVIGMEAVNEDAENVLEGIDFKNQNIEDAISKAVEKIAENGYFDNEGGNIFISSSSKNDKKSEELSGKLMEIAQSQVDKDHVKADIESESLGYNMVKKAKELGLTPGKYNIITNLLGEKVGDNANESIKDLMKRYISIKSKEDLEDDEDELESDEDKSEDLDDGTEEAKEKVEEKVEKKKEKVEKAKEKAEEKVEKEREKVEKAKEKAEEKVEKEREKVEKAKEKAEEKVEKKKEKVEKAKEKVEEKAEKKKEKSEEAKERTEKKAEKKKDKHDEDEDEDDDE